MKITDYFGPHQQKNNETPAATRRKTRISRRQPTRISNSENNTEEHGSAESDEDEPEYSLRKIVIRLADPNVPDSYICEVYDTSVDEERPSLPSPNKNTASLNGKPCTRSSSGCSSLTTRAAQYLKTKKRPRHKTPSTEQNQKLESSSSSDEELILVRKKIRVDKKCSSSNETVIGNAPRLSSEKENAESPKETRPSSTRRSSRRVSSLLGNERKTTDTDAAKSPDSPIKKEDIAQWRKSIKEQCLKSPPASPIKIEIDKNVKIHIKQRSSRRLTGPSNKLCDPSIDIKKSSTTNSSLSIKKYFNSPIAANSKELDENGKINLKKNLSDKVRSSENKILSPLKDCRVSLQRTPIKFKDSLPKEEFKSPTKECSIYLERLSDKCLKEADALKTPTKESPFALPKAPVSSGAETPTKDCIVLLEKLTPEKSFSEIGISKAPLAPLFLKRSQKKPPASNSKAKTILRAKQAVNVDSAVLKAREKFLQSGVPNCTRKNKEIVNKQELHTSFYSVRHVQQRNHEKEWHPRSVSLNLGIPVDHFAKIRSSVWKLPIQSTPTRPVQSLTKSRSATLDETVKNLSETFKNIKVDNIYRLLKKQYDEHTNETQELHPLWSQKYKPDCTYLISNTKTVAKLTRWLESWKIYNEETRDGVRRGRNSCYSEIDDFVSSDEEPGNSRVPITACLIHGPTSSGKTSVIQAIANHLDFHILEINASSKRSGKKMLADLQEATRSHKILQESSGNISRPGDKMSLIVVEEADIVFEDQDEGFVSGLQNLIASAKRPVVLLTTEVNVPHLEKFRNSQVLQLSMSLTSVSLACVISEIVCLLEGASPSRTSILRLLKKNNCDLRRSLLELQFWIEGNTRAALSWPLLKMIPFSIENIWWASHQAFFKQDLWQSTSTTALLPEKTNAPTPNIDGECIRNYVAFAENISVCDILSRGNIYSSELSNCHAVLKDSVSLDNRNVCEHEQNNRQSTDIENDLVDHMRRYLPNTINDCIHMPRFSDIESRWLSTIKKASEELLVVVPLLNKGVASTDYLSALREICRSEKERVATNTKRKNRFYHYLRTIGGTPTQANLEVNCELLAPTRLHNTHVANL